LHVQRKYHEENRPGSWTGLVNVDSTTGDENAHAHGDVGARTSATMDPMSHTGAK